MYKCRPRKNNILKKMVVIWIIIFLLSNMIAPIFASNTETSKDQNVDSQKIQKVFDQQMMSLMKIDDSSDVSAQDVTQTMKDYYPQYADYDGEMESFSVNKTWTGDAVYDRPESVIFDLYLGDKIIDTLTVTAKDDWKGNFDHHYPAYKLDEKGNYVLNSKGEKVLLDYEIKERKVADYKASYDSKVYQNAVDTSKVHLFVPAKELKAGEKYIAVSSNQPGQQKIYRAEAYQTDKMLNSKVTISNGIVKGQDGTKYNNYILLNDTDNSYEGLLWNAYSAGNNSYYMFSNVYELWGQCHGLIQMPSTQSKMSCLHVDRLGVGTNASTQAFYYAGNEKLENAYKTASSSENLYFYKEVTLSEGVFNSWQMETFVSNRYDPPITVEPGSGEDSEKTDISVTKKWENDTEKDRPESVTVHLYADGKDTGKTLTLTKAENWAGSFKDLNVYKDGKKISYSVSEDVPDGYSAQYQYSNLENAENDSSRKGCWVRTNKLVDGETYLIVTSPNEGSVIGMEINSSGNGFGWTSGNAGTINVGGQVTINGQTYTTHITQEEAQKHQAMQWTAHSKGASTANQVGYHNWFLLESVSNPGCYPKFNGQGDISDGTAHESLLYYGQQWKMGNGGQKGYVALDEKGNAQNRTPTVKNYPDDFNYILGAYNDYFLLTNQHTGDANAMTAQTFYLYKYVESSGASVTITNKKSNKTSLTVYKNWNDENDKYQKRPDSIEVELLENGVETGIKAKLDNSNGWKYIFDNLPKFDKNGKEIAYSAKEGNLPKGYTSSILTGTSGGVIEDITYSYAWVPITSMEAGKEYILVVDNKGTLNTIGVSNNKATIKGSLVQVTSERILTDEVGNHYSTYITDKDAGKVTKWSTESSGDHILLKNNGKYLEKGEGNLVDVGKATKICYDDVNHALKASNGKYMASNGDFNKNNPEVTTYIYERVKIKNTTMTDTTQNVTTITNTYKGQKAEFFLQKLDGNSEKKLTGNYRFTLKDKNGNIVDKNENVQVDEKGQIYFKDIAYGEYFLEEVRAEDHYGKLSKQIQISISEEGIKLENASELVDWVKLSKTSGGIDVINVKNYKLIQMPETGSNSEMKVMLLGISLLIGGTLLMINCKKEEW